MTDIDEATRTYLVAIEIEGKSPRTVASYANSLEDFRRVSRRLGHPDSPEAYAVPHVYEFLGALRERGASPGYQHRRHREVKTCFSWLKRMDFIEDNVFAKVPLVRRPRVVKPPFTPEQITALLETQDRSIRKCWRGNNEPGSRSTPCTKTGDWPTALPAPAAFSKPLRGPHGRGRAVAGCGDQQLR